MEGSEGDGRKAQHLSVGDDGNATIGTGGVLTEPVFDAGFMVLMSAGGQDMDAGGLGSLDVTETDGAIFLVY